VTRLAACLVLAAALGGCAVAPVAPPPAMPVDAKALEQWTASGRIAVAAHGEGGSGSFTWEQSSSATTLSIRGPLGAGAMRVTSDGRSMAVTDAEGRTLDDEQAQALLRQRLGIDLPVADLRYWMLGVPSPGSPSSIADATEAPRRVIEQSGWWIGYDSFRPWAGLSLPERFTATQGGVRLKVIVDDWQGGTAAGRGP
jgi:outer membrane lipoprotein LolB